MEVKVDKDNWSDYHIHKFEWKEELFTAGYECGSVSIRKGKEKILGYESSYLDDKSFEEWEKEDV